MTDFNNLKQELTDIRDAGHVHFEETDNAIVVGSEDFESSIDLVVDRRKSNRKKRNRRH